MSQNFLISEKQLLPHYLNFLQQFPNRIAIAQSRKAKGEIVTSSASML
ncbi:hypothetical protein [Nostoc sp. DedQUE09]|nr:hypothetical protein [Nostoc sp. DedQUE09]MDZ7954943.1 hypothetical protein [Nostoc sp. DedQUE09]